MIQVADLAIGNWVYDEESTQFPMRVQAIGEDYVCLNFEGSEAEPWVSTPEELQGVPLTAELLEKIGFSFSSGLWRHSLGVKVKPEDGFVFIENKDEEKWLYSYGFFKGIHYLHQLQNLLAIVLKQEFKIEL